MTELVDTLVASKEGMDPALFSFDGDDLDDLRARASDTSRADCIRAIEILAPVIPTDALAAAAPLVAGGDPGRAAAALAAIVPADEEAIPLALAAAVSRDEVVARAAWLTLQQVGRSAGLDALALAAATSVPDVQSQATFAQSVVACRAGVAGHEVPDPDAGSLLELDRAGEVSFIEASPCSDADFARLTDLSTPQRYLLTPDQSATTLLICNGVDMLLAVDAEVRDALPDTLLQAPAMLGLVGILDPFHATCSVSLLIFTRPDGAGGLRVSVHDPGGDVLYAGVGSLSDGTVQLSVQSVALPGAVPVAISGTLTTAGLVLTEALSAAQVAPSAPKLEATIDADDIPIL